MPALTVIAKAALPVLMLAGGGVAWASSGGASEPTGAAQAWVDSPMDGERLEPGTVRVRAHASAPGGVTRIELAVDGRTVADESAGGDDRLGVVTLDWEATAGVHELQVRGESDQGWSGYSSTVTVQVGEPAAVPTTTTTTTTTSVPATTVVDTTTSSTADTTTPTTVVAAPTTTRAGSPRTSAPRTTVPGAPATTPPTSPGGTAPPTTATPSGPATTKAPGTTAPATTAYPAPTVSVSGPSTQFVGIPVTLTATGAASGRPFSLVISVQSSPGGNMVPITTCTSSPCSVNRTFNDVGSYQYFATITVNGVGTQSASKSILIKLIG